MGTGYKVPKRALSGSTGKQLKEEGQSRVESNSKSWVSWMRGEARKIARSKGEVSVNDLWPIVEKTGRTPHHPNAWGSIFRSGWECVGWVKNRRPKAHARDVRVWKLKETKNESTNNLGGGDNRSGEVDAGKSAGRGFRPGGFIRTR